MHKHRTASCKVLSLEDLPKAHGMAQGKRLDNARPAGQKSVVGPIRRYSRAVEYTCDLSPVLSTAGKKATGPSGDPLSTLSNPTSSVGRARIVDPGVRSLSPCQTGTHAFGAPLPKKAGLSVPWCPASAADKVRAAASSTGLELAVVMQATEQRQNLRHPGNLEYSPRAATQGRQPVALGLIDKFIQRELRLARESDVSTEPAPGYQRLNIFRQAFVMLNSIPTVYNQLLETIISEYENFITLLEHRMHTPGKEKKEVYQQFDTEVQIMRTNMRDTLMEKESALKKREEHLKQREAQAKGEVEKLQAETERLQQDISRLHEQNLTLAHNVVDYRFQNQRYESQLKASEQLDRRYQRLHQDHQALLEMIATSPGDTQAAYNPAATEEPGSPSCQTLALASTSSSCPLEEKT
ncbi:hypothetical protein DIPPA_17510 [Diplonema papillatum]|nr:hypothetical protein DIPPA_17510 [Diplonema papillatum]|eukprot:gene5829-8922_t